MNTCAKRLVLLGLLSSTVVVFAADKNTAVAKATNGWFTTLKTQAKSLGQATTKAAKTTLKKGTELVSNVASSQACKTGIRYAKNAGLFVANSFTHPLTGSPEQVAGKVATVAAIGGTSAYALYKTAKWAFGKRVTPVTLDDATLKRATGFDAKKQAHANDLYKQLKK